ncbi:trehalose 6-phosphatase [Austwickia chelonae]|uniref:Trehalose 6-phosphate phosphatase n=1 Tax=Austwickia chelonae NBRC 105200 TaxID=1184607 RepID=K6V6H8_9MICO|nr:trehalose-phosphatase [Austwickia chelonae]GAB77843.1 trehalose-phosphatase [Austwickia chelonae NBRC 105200]SEV90663.1 trehalose 6-phosphatase [Austwickia chelonae]
MEPALTPELIDRIHRMAALDSVLLASDFDGTVAPFEDDPMQVSPAPGAIEALQAAARLPGVTVALVSGRELAVLRELSGVGDDPPIVLIGTHGAQSTRRPGSGSLTDAQRSLLAQIDQALQEVCSAHEGSRVERKPAAVVLHTRGMAEPGNSRALAAAAEVHEHFPGSHGLHGKDVFEIGVVRADKGSALADLAEETSSEGTIFLGDDVTDERAFEVLDAAAGDLTVKVGPGETAAGARVRDVAGAVAVLQEFVAARSSFRRRTY